MAFSNLFDAVLALYFVPKLGVFRCPGQLNGRGKQAAFHQEDGLGTLSNSRYVVGVLQRFKQAYHLLFPIGNVQVINHYKTTRFEFGHPFQPAVFKFKGIEGANHNKPFGALKPLFAADV